jgi:hypothetical protein
MNERVRAFLKNPPPGSKTRAALDFGIDLTLTVRNAFVLTPGERLERMQAAQIGPPPKVVSRAGIKPDA